MASTELVQFLREIPAFTPLKDKEIEMLAEAAQFKSYELGERVLEQGSSTDGLFIIYSGKFRLFEERDGTEQSMGLRGPGELIGELGALQDLPIEYSVRSSSRSELLCFPRQDMTKVLALNSEAERFLTQYIVMASTGKFLTRFLNLQRKVDREELERIVNSIGLKKVKEGQVILEQGSDEDRRLYVVQSGLIRLQREHKGSDFTIGLLGEEEIFGAKTCMEEVAHEESAIAMQDSVVFLVPPDTVKLLTERNSSLKHLLESQIEKREREFRRQQKLAERRKPRVMVDLFTQKGLGDRVIKRFPLVEQAEEMDCGAACLAMICKHYKIPMTMGKLREMANVTREGATMDSLAKVGESLGFSCKGMRCTYKQLLTFDLPFVAHWEGYHYIIVYGISKKHVWVADPGPGFRKMTIEEFEKGWNGHCLLFAPTDAVYQVDTGVEKPWTRFFRFLLPHKKLIRDLFIATLVIELLGLVSPLLTQAIIDKVIVHANANLLVILIIGAFIAMAFTNITSLMRTYLSNFLIRKMDFAMMSQFYKHILALPLSFFAKRKVGDIMARFNENETIRDFLTDTSISTILNIFMLFIYLSVMFVFNIKLSLIFLAFVPLFVILTLYSTPKYKEYARKTFYMNAESESLLMESLAAAETIKGMGVERPMRVKWEKKYADVVNIRHKSEMFTAGIGAVSQLLNFGVMTTILYFGAKLVIDKQLSIGQLVAFNQLVGSVMSPIMGLIGTWDELHEAGVSMERLGDVLDLDPEQKATETTQRIVIPDLHGNIRFENIYFRYGGSESPYVLKNINFEMEAGKTYAFVGGSGSGKTTLAKVLVGFYPPSEGSIFVDGYDLSNIDLNSFRAQIGYVMQSNVLFSGTVSSNIALGDNDPDPRRIIEVSRMADAHDFISATHLGYQLQVGERGTGLSGGQVQRICIARALYHDPRLIVLDEATSALDTQTENVIQQNMEKVLKNRTAVVIAHRLSTIMNADKIFVMFEGSITEQGNHDELLAKRGMYYHLVKNQLAGYKAEQLDSV